MKYLAQIKHLNDDVEEEVLLHVNGVDLVCFAAYCPYKLQERCDYQIELTAQVFDDYLISEVDEETPSSVARIDNSFAYILTGKLRGRCIETGSIIFEDDLLLSNFGHLEGKMITWRVDRLDVEFA